MSDSKPRETNTATSGEAPAVEADFEAFQREMAQLALENRAALDAWKARNYPPSERLLTFGARAAEALQHVPHFPAVTAVRAVRLERGIQVEEGVPDPFASEAIPTDMVLAEVAPPVDAPEPIAAVVVRDRKGTRTGDRTAVFGDFDIGYRRCPVHPRSQCTGRLVRGDKLPTTGGADGTTPFCGEGLIGKGAPAFSMEDRGDCHNPEPDAIPIFESDLAFTGADLARRLQQRAERHMEQLKVWCSSYEEAFVVATNTGLIVSARNAADGLRRLADLIEQDRPAAGHVPGYIGQSPAVQHRRVDGEWITEVFQPGKGWTPQPD